MSDIKPIETEYNGYKFRSKLEARWAVFFDQIGVKYEFEVQGFSFDGINYLPDFWLPDQDLFVEIKRLDYIAADELIKPVKFALHSEKSVMICFGVPEWRAYPVYSEGFTESIFNKENINSLTNEELIQGTLGGCLIPNSNGNVELLFPPNLRSVKDQECPQLYREACQKAKSHRFGKW